MDEVTQQYNNELTRVINIADNYAAHRKDDQVIPIEYLQMIATNNVKYGQDIARQEEQEERWRNQLIFLSGGSNSKGGGISLCQVSRKGAVDYAKVPELRGVNLEPYRKASSISWRITRDV